MIRVDETRHQARNREIARARLVELVREALTPPRRRIPTRVSASQKRKRLDAKKARAEVKARRGWHR